MQPITVFCAFSRLWAFGRWLEDFSKLSYPQELINMCFIVDGDEPVITAGLLQYARNNHYRSAFVHMNDDWTPNETKIAIRRKRIADIKNQSKAMIQNCDGDIIIGFEDDTIFPTLDLNRLIDPMREDENVGFVEGVQCGRWGVKMIGAWSVDDYEHPNKAETLFVGSGYQEIDAGGWYGYATRRDLYLEHDYSWNNEPWGPDVNYGLWLRNRGYKCLIDWESKFGHDDHGPIGWPDENISKVVYTRNPDNNEWRREDVDG